MPSAGFETAVPAIGAAADLRLGPHGHRDRTLFVLYIPPSFLWTIHTNPKRLFEPSGGRVLLGPSVANQYSDSLRARRSGDRMPVAAMLAALIQIVGEAHPPSCTLETGSLPAGAKPASLWC